MFILGCAAVVLPIVLLGGGWWLYSGLDDDASSQIERISEQVTLTTSDGLRIILDSTNVNGRIIDNGNIAVVRENGQIRYEAGEDAETRLDEQTSIRIDVPRGQFFDMPLPDGSHVWLNADSHLSFNTDFAGSQRHVELDGEAYFEVAHDSDRPFIVETATQSLTVLGTSFNISAYSDEPVVYTTLTEGSVALDSKTTGTQAVLLPGQQARLDAGASAYDISEVNAAYASMWRDEIFVFDGETLDRVFLKLTRRYDFSYTFDDPAIAGLKLMGEIPAYDDVNRIFNQIETLGQIWIECRGKSVRIKNAL